MTDDAQTSDTPTLLRLKQLDTDLKKLKLANGNPEGANLFAVLGHTHTERWHSAFLAWLLDPRGTHGLGSLALTHLLKAAATTRLRPTADEDPSVLQPSELEQLVARDVLSGLSFDVQPNERTQLEKSLNAENRVDVWIEARIPGTDSTPPMRFICIIEMKVKSSLGEDQGRRYADWLAEQHRADPSTRGLCIFIAPTSAVDAADSADITSDPRWYCMDYQWLCDQVLIPCQRSTRPALPKDAAMIVDHYIENLRSSRKGERLAMTDQERQLARELWDRHQDTIGALVEIILTPAPCAEDSEERVERCNQATRIREALDGAGATTEPNEPTQRELLLREFWADMRQNHTEAASLLPEMRDNRSTVWRKCVTRNGVLYSYVPHSTTCAVVLEFKDNARALYERLSQDEDKVNHLFGGELKFDEHKIIFTVGSGGYASSRETWPEIQHTLVRAMARLSEIVEMYRGHPVS